MISPTDRTLNRRVFRSEVLPLHLRRVPVEDLDEFSAGGVRFTRMPIAPLTTDAGAMGMWLYASEHVLQGYAPRVGDEIEGFAWLQATLASTTRG